MKTNAALKFSSLRSAKIAFRKASNELKAALDAWTDYENADQRAVHVAADANEHAVYRAALACGFDVDPSRYGDCTRDLISANMD